MALTRSFQSAASNQKPKQDFETGIDELVSLFSDITLKHNLPKDVINVIAQYLNPLFGIKYQAFLSPTNHFQRLDHLVSDEKRIDLKRFSFYPLTIYSAFYLKTPHYNIKPIIYDFESLVTSFKKGELRQIGIHDEKDLKNCAEGIMPLYVPTLIEFLKYMNPKNCPVPYDIPENDFYYNDTERNKRDSEIKEWKEKKRIILNSLEDWFRHDSNYKMPKPLCIMKEQWLDSQLLENDNKSLSQEQKKLLKEEKFIALKKTLENVLTQPLEVDTYQEYIANKQALQNRNFWTKEKIIYAIFLLGDLDFVISLMTYSNPMLLAIQGLSSIGHLYQRYCLYHYLFKDDRNNLGNDDFVLDVFAIAGSGLSLILLCYNFPSTTKALMLSISIISEFLINLQYDIISLNKILLNRATIMMLGFLLYLKSFVPVNAMDVYYFGPGGGDFLQSMFQTFFRCLNSFIPFVALTRSLLKEEKSTEYQDRITASAKLLPVESIFVKRQLKEREPLSSSQIVMNSLAVIFAIAVASSSSPMTLLMVGLGATINLYLPELIKEKPFQLKDRTYAPFISKPPTIVV